MIFLGITSMSYLYLNLLQELKMEKKSSHLYLPDDNADLGGNSTKNDSSDPMVDEEAPLITSTRISHLGRSNLSS